MRSLSSTRLHPSGTPSTWCSAVRHLGPHRHVLVGQQVGVAARHLVGEGRPELAGRDAAAAQLAVRAEERAFVPGRAAHQIAVLAARPLLGLAAAQPRSCKVSPYSPSHGMAVVADRRDRVMRSNANAPERSAPPATPRCPGRSAASRQRTRVPISRDDQPTCKLYHVASRPAPVDPLRVPWQRAGSRAGRLVPVPVPVAATTETGPRLLPGMSRLVMAKRTTSVHLETIRAAVAWPAGRCSIICSTSAISRSRRSCFAANPAPGASWRRPWPAAPSARSSSRAAFRCCPCRSSISAARRR